MTFLTGNTGPKLNFTRRFFVSHEFNKCRRHINASRNVCRGLDISIPYDPFFHNLHVSRPAQGENQVEGSLRK
ncbi:hypothetical protein [Methanosarcina sp. 1.H.A.2.2]|uniref:hypothetical protein n=1 Tax=Methanosarcina sp. 1.H.A.2.2 TaxID=1483601 RepID=UPI001910BC3F|nr:hypothetical protein [Methanosarcina sp. 1.H.A.2.2]